MQKAKTTPQIPELTETQLEFLRMYRRLEQQLGRAPSLAELANERGGYATGSERAGAQRMMQKLTAAGVVEMPRLVGGGTTTLGKRTLKRYGSEG